MKIQYHMPTHVIMETGCVQNHADIFKSLGKKALIVTGRASAAACGALDDVTRALGSNGQAWSVFDRVLSNPSIASVYEGAAFARSEGADFVIGIGGGSPMDAAKAIALLARQDIPEERLFAGGYTADVLPVVLIPTTAGTGSEVTQYAVLTNDRAETKMSIGSDYLFPAYALLDARYTLGLLRTGTINTAIDALSHAVEGMLTVRANPFSDAIALESIARIASAFTALKSGELTLADRENLLYAAMLAGVVIVHTKTTTVHAMGYCLTYFKGLDHGHATGLFLAEFLDFTARQKPELVQRILAAMQLDSVAAFRTVLMDLFGPQVRLTPEEIDRFTAIAAKSKSVANSQVVPTADDIRGFFAAVLG